MNLRNLLIVIALGIGLVLLPFFMASDAPGPGRAAQISYSDFRQLVAERAVAHVEFSDTVARGELLKERALGTAATVTEKFTVRIPPFKDTSLLDQLDAADTTYEFSPGKGETTGTGILLSIVPWLLLIGFYIWFTRRMGQNVAGGLGGKGGFKQFLEGSSKREEDKSSPTVTFDDVAGQESAKREVSELVDYLAQPERFERLGAEAPHGVLLMGPPGTGKTLLARTLPFRSLTDLMGEFCITPKTEENDGPSRATSATATRSWRALTTPPPKVENANTARSSSPAASAVSCGAEPRKWISSVV